jgi:hypothetical protein
MKTVKSPVMTVLMAALLAVSLTASAKDKDKPLDPPPEGKAVVYMGKMNAFVGAAWPFHFFVDDQYVARVKGKNYARVIVEPGDHLFWVAMQSRRTFVKAKVEAGHSYALYAKLTQGAELLPITRDSTDWKEFGGMITGSKPLDFSQKDVDEWKAEQPDYIEKALAEWKAAGEPALKLMADEHID